MSLVFIAIEQQRHEDSRPIGNTVTQIQQNAHKPSIMAHIHILGAK